MEFVVRQQHVEALERPSKSADIKKGLFANGEKSLIVVGVTAVSGFLNMKNGLSTARFPFLYSLRPGQGRSRISAL